MSLGCVLENMWLMASSLGIGVHIVSALSSYRVEREIKQLLNIPAHLTVAISFRLGYPVASPKYLRVRRDVNVFAHHNSFAAGGL
jgi:nitroreductase